MSRTVAVTGATGFIGRTLSARLEQEGWRVRALARRRGPISHRQPASTEWIPGDLADEASLERLVRGADAVVHCAGAVRGATWADFAETNVAGLARLVDAVRRQAPAARFLLLSSLAAREPHLSFYAASKREGEKVLQAHGEAMRWAALRPPAVYGPGDREVLPLFRWMGRGIGPVLGGGRARFSLVYVEDLAAAVTTLVGGAFPVGRIFALHDGRPGGYSWPEVFDTASRLTGRRIRPVRVPQALLAVAARLNAALARCTGRSPMLTPGKVRELRHRDWVCDNADITRETSWTPNVSLEEGLRRTMGWGPGSAAGEPAQRGTWESHG
ncbi:MAG: NAD-dependent epimerase/dehydratase family protein [Deferrisomatales bacterium]